MRSKINAISNLIKKDRNKVSVLDLFFDITLIVFIGGISNELIKHLEGDQNWRLITIEIVQLFSIFFIWRVYMLFAIVSFQGIAYRLLTMAAMTSLFTMGIATFYSVSTKDAFLINVIGFVVSMLVLIFSLIMWMNKHNELKNTRKRVSLLLGSFGLSIVIVFIALGVNYSNLNPLIVQDVIIGLWIFNLIHLFGTDIATSHLDHIYSKETTDLIEERYNVIFVLFSGEGLISIISAFAEAHTGTEIFDKSFAYVVISFFLIFGWWWLFNDHITYTALRSKIKNITRFTYLMLPFLFGITLMFMGFVLMVEGSPDMGVVIYASAQVIMALSFVLLLRQQENYKKEHFYLRRKKWELGLNFSAILASIIQMLIAVFVQEPFWSLGINGAFIIIATIMTYIEFLKSSAPYIGNPKLYEEDFAKRNQDINGS